MPTSASPSNPSPWHTRPAVLRGIMLLLTLSVLAEGALVLHTQRRLGQIVTRVEGLRILADLGLGARPGKLLVVTAEDELHTLRDLRELQAHAQAWLQDFALRRSLEPEVTEILAGVLSATVAAWGDYRILQAVGGLGARDADGFSDDVERRCYRAVDQLLAPTEAEAFRAELTPLWETWTAERSP